MGFNAPRAINPKLPTSSLVVFCFRDAYMCVQYSFYNSYISNVFINFSDVYVYRILFKHVKNLLFKSKKVFSNMTD